MSSFVKGGGGGENLKAEVAAQTDLIEQIREALVGKVTLANATPETILEGFCAYVGRELVEGTFDIEESMANMFGVSKVAVDKFVSASTLTTDTIINHSLDRHPSVVILMKVGRDSIPSKGLLFVGGNCEGYSGAWPRSMAYVYNGSQSDTSGSSRFSNINSNNITYTPSSGNGILPAGIEYTLITMA